MQSILIVIPAFNEEYIIDKVLDTLPRTLPGIGTVDLLVIDDGSTDRTYEVVKKRNVNILRHLINRGLGAALHTGFKYAIELKYDFIITFDADGQHSPADIPRIIKPLYERNAEVVIGSRLLSKSSMPLIRRLINYMSNILTLLLFNIWTTDSQSGLRGFTRESLLQIKLNSQRMEVSSEIFKEINRLKLKVVEVPIKTIYSRYSLTKGQKISNAPVIMWKLFLSKFI